MSYLKHTYWDWDGVRREQLGKQKGKEGKRENKNSKNLSFFDKAEKI